MAPFTRRVILFSAPLQSLQLTGIFFLEYLSSAALRGDLAEAVCSITALLPILRSGPHFQTLLAFYGRLLGERFFFRAIECLVAALCVYGPTFTQDAVVFHYLNPLLMEYRFSRFFLTRALKAVGRALYPRFLRQLVFGPGSDAATTQERVNRMHQQQQNDDNNNVEDDGVNLDILYAQDPPPAPPARSVADPIEEEAFYRTVPPGCLAGMRFYRASYTAHTFRAVLANAFVREASGLLLEGAFWASRFYNEQKKDPSLRLTPWRVWKPFCGYVAGTVTQLSLTALVRTGGAKLGRAIRGDELTGAGFFWGEQLLCLLAAPAIVKCAALARVAVEEGLERRHPTTPEDANENMREKREQEDADRASGFYYFEAANNMGDASEQERFKKGVDFYKVLGVDEKAQGNEIKKAYRQLALKNHPDRVGTNALAQNTARDNMAVINEAYDVLINENTRMQYDASRLFADTPDFLNNLDKLSPKKFALVASGGGAVVYLASGVVVYAQYCSMFQMVGDSGRGPLRGFAFMAEEGAKTEQQQ